MYARRDRRETQPGDPRYRGRLLRRTGSTRTVVVVEDDMDFMRSYADSVTVLHAGKVLSEGTVQQVQADAAVQEVYLGRASAATEGTS